ncbi:MAG: hypothetical protein L0Z50_19390, partial [Verrucomicrobiales bacterium]|nr:hypothetical protein [Verrucomicrobiales bacterium]
HPGLLCRTKTAGQRGDCDGRVITQPEFAGGRVRRAGGRYRCSFANQRSPAYKFAVRITQQFGGIV